MRNYPITGVKGIGSRKAELFAKLGIYTLYDLLNYFPRNYTDLTKPTPISALNSGIASQNGEAAVVIAKVVSLPEEKRIRGDMVIYRFSVSDADPAVNNGEPTPADTLKITVFNRKYTAAALTAGQELTLVGKVTGFGFYKEMASPTIYFGHEKGFRPIYPLTSGVTQKALVDAIRYTLSLGAEKLNEILPENLPESLIKEHGLISRAQAYIKIHMPLTADDIAAARRRLGFEELFVFRLGLSILKRKTETGKAHRIEPLPPAQTEALFPFTLTDAQKKVINDSLTDMSKDTPMSRMIQGDVGSGKTAVAAALCYTAARSGFQSCLMAPTEILALQHYHGLSELLGKAGIKTDILTGSTTAAEKRKVKQRLLSGETNLLIGTHALIESDIEFKNLALAVTDEQHRFGVKQRSLLSDKCADGFVPHVAVMSATPIPRSLALILYGDLSLSVIDTLPGGRKKVSTFLLDSTADDRMFGYVASEAKKGFQSYIVCPLVEEGEDKSIKSVEQFYNELKDKYFSDIPAAFIHGRMKGKDKERILREFTENKINVLVSTTVIEVGVNVPNATVMIIKNAERFGLSQLHQLRGRVGRGTAKSYCFLSSDTENEQTIERLNTLCETNDGFIIAKKDLEQRGPGDFFGQRQHGLPEFRIADLVNDMELTQTASASADSFIKQEPDWFRKQEYEALRTAVSGFFARTDGTDGGVNI